MRFIGYDATLRYADSAWYSTGFRRVGSTPVPGRAAVRARPVAGRRGSHVGRNANDGVSLVSRLDGRGPDRAESGRAGRKPRLDARQLAELDTALRAGAHAHGFSTNLWTL